MAWNCGYIHTLAQRRRSARELRREECTRNARCHREPNEERDERTFVYCTSRYLPCMPFYAQNSKELELIYATQISDCPTSAASKTEHIQIFVPFHLRFIFNSPLNSLRRDRKHVVCGTLKTYDLTHGDRDVHHSTIGAGPDSWRDGVDAHKCIRSEPRNQVD